MDDIISAVLTVVNMFGLLCKGEANLNPQQRKTGEKKI